MYAPTLVQAATLQQFLDAWEKWDAEQCLAVFANDFTQTTLPLGLGIPTRSRAEVEHVFPALVATVKSYQLTVHNIVHDAAKNVAAVYASSTGNLPWGPWKMDYTAFVTFSEAGDKVARLEEMLDTAFLQDFGPKFGQYLQAHGGPMAVAAGAGAGGEAGGEVGGQLVAEATAGGETVPEATAGEEIIAEATAEGETVPEATAVGDKHVGILGDANIKGASETVAEATAVGDTHVGILSDATINGASETVAETTAIGNKHVSILSDANINGASLDEANRLLQKNHEEWHMFFRDRAGHNHIAHSILTCLALGAAPDEIQRAYDDGVGIQRPIPDIDARMVERLSDDETLYETLGTITQYTTFLVFFERQIEQHGWQETVNRFVLSRGRVAERMLARMFEGAYHPVIHLGLGIEFQRPAIIAEALAQAAAHDDSHIGTLFEACEAQAGIAYPPKNPKPLIQLLHQMRNNETIRNAPRWEDFGNKMRDGVVGRACLEMSFVASQFCIKPEDLQRRTAEMISTCAYMAGASQRPGRKRKIDFFYMHAVTSSIFFSVIIRQEWIKLEDRVRMVEWKGRLDLAWYVVSGCAELYADAVTDYHDGFSDAMGWEDLYAAVNKEHDDGHVAKLIRALKNGQEAAKPFESGEFSESFPVKGDMWLKIARMVLDTTKDWPTDQKFVNFTGFDMGWKIRPDLA